MEKRTQDYTKEILEVIRSNISPAVLSKRLQDFHENDIADVLPELSSAERNKLYRIFDLDTLSDILEYTDEEMAVTYLEEMSLKKAAAILSRTETNILAEILQHFDKEKRGTGQGPAQRHHRPDGRRCQAGADPFELL